MNPTGLKIEMHLSGSWTDVTSYVYVRDGVQLKHGRSTWSGAAEPSSARFTLDNRTGIWSPDNVTGTYSRIWRRNVPVRISVLDTSNDPVYRFHGEIASLPVRWNLRGNDQWAPVEANGILRRLRQSKVEQSVIRRAYAREVVSSNVVTYWPMEEKGNQYIQQFGPAIGNQPLTIVQGVPDPASNSNFLASDDLPTLVTDKWVGKVDPYSPSSEAMVRFVFQADPAMAAIDGADIMEFHTSSLFYVIQYFGSTGGDLRVLGYNIGSSFSLEFDSGNLNHNIGSNPVRISLNLTTPAFPATGTTWSLTTVDQTNGAVTTSSGTVSSSYSVGVATKVVLNPYPDGDSYNMTIGHVAVERLSRTGDVADDLTAYAGETAGNRVIRLADEEGLAYSIEGDPDDSVRMGPQGVASVATLLEDAARTDLGILFDPAETFGVGYRTGASIKNQSEVSDRPAFEVDYSAHETYGTMELDRDDRNFSNDITVKNWDGATTRVELTDGDYSVSEPPDGAGRYDTSFTINAYDNSELPGHASSRLTLYSVDEPRLSKLGFATQLSAADKDTVLGLMPGDRVLLTGLPANVYPYNLGQIIQGWSETIKTHEHFIAVNTTSDKPWQTGMIEGDTADGEVIARYDTAGSELASGVSAAATSMSVATTLGPLWTTAGADFPFDVLVDGVRVTVTAISGSSSPQTFTVAGATVVRALASGADVRLADPTYYSL
ncbi:MAG: hypothetical protein R2761_23560 [Acidimicrobiales bacterium]